MTTLLRTLLLLAASALALNLSAAQKNNNPDLARFVAQQDQQRKELMQLLNDFKKSAHDKDINAIMSIYDPNVLAYDIAPPLQYAGAAAYRKTWQAFLDAYDGPLEVEYRDLHLGFSGDMAYSYCLERFSGTPKGGKRTDLWIRVSDIYQRKNGKWLIVHEHVSVPTDFDTGKSLLDLKPDAK